VFAQVVNDISPTNLATKSYDTAKKMLNKARQELFEDAQEVLRGNWVELEDGIGAKHFSWSAALAVDILASD